MVFANYGLPHRLLVNRALRKESDVLRERIAAYQEEKKNKIADANKEIEIALADANSSFEKAKKSFGAQLAHDQELLLVVQSNLFEYTDVFFKHRASKQVLDLLHIEQKAISDNIVFLGDQMKLIGEEIMILEDRKSRLASQTDIKDVLALLALSGCDLHVENDETAQTLLSKVVSAAKECDKGTAKRNALFKLAEKLQERAELLPLISYISWIIQQKIQFSKELSLQRKRLKEEFDSKQVEIENTKNAHDQLSRTKTEIARRVREYWAVPVAELGVELTAYYGQKSSLPKYSARARELKNLCEEHKEISRQLKSMAESHSDDSYRWDRLQRERKVLSDEIETAKDDLEKIRCLEASIESTKRTRNEWYEKRRSILETCSKSNVYLLSDYNSGESDEIRIVSERLTVYLQRQAKIEDENRAALARVQKAKADVISELEATICEAQADLKKAQGVYIEAQISFQKTKESDKRLFLIKLFAESGEVATARKNLSIKKECLESAQSRLSSLFEEKEKQEKLYDKKVKDFRGAQDASLASTINKYQRRLEELASHNKHTSKNEGKNDDAQI